MLDYRWHRARFKPKVFNAKNELKDGTWVPLSIAGHLSGYTVQNLRVLCFQGSIQSAKFKVGPLLVQMESIERYKETLYLA